MTGFKIIFYLGSDLSRVSLLKSSYTNTYGAKKQMLPKIFFKFYIFPMHLFDEYIFDTEIYLLHILINYM